MIPEILFLVEQIRSTTAQVYNLWTPVPILFQTRTLKAVEGVGDALTAAHDALVLVIAERALVADTGQRCRAHVRVADGTFTVAFVA